MQLDLFRTSFFAIQAERERESEGREVGAFALHIHFYLLQVKTSYRRIQNHLQTVRDIRSHFYLLTSKQDSLRCVEE